MIQSRRSRGTRQGEEGRAEGGQRQGGAYLADIREGGGGDALEGELGLLDAQHEERHGARVDHRLREVAVVPRDVAERPRRRLLDARVELLEAAHQRVERARVDDGLRGGGDGEG